MRYKPGQADSIAMIPSDSKFDMAKAMDDFPVLTTLRRVFGNDASGIAAILDKIGDIHAEQKRFDAALKELHRGLEVRLKIRGERHPDVALSYLKIGSIYQSQGKLAEARDLLRKAVFAPGRRRDVPQVRTYLP